MSENKTSKEGKLKKNRLNLTQENVISENVTNQNLPTNPSEKTFKSPSISGFWRRFFAWAIDTLLLGVIGLLIGVVFSSYLLSIGPYGRPIGLLLIIPYFGICNSKIGGGQTLGKRLMKIAVRDKNNEPIDLWRSIFRIVILYLPVLLNGWAIPFFQNPLVSWLASIIVFGFGGALLYTMIFNKKTRQGFHDLLLGTYVIQLPGKMISSFPKTKRINWIIPNAWIAIVAIGFMVVTFLIPTSNSKLTTQKIRNLNSIFETDAQFFSTRIVDRTNYISDGNTTHYMIITGWYKGKLNNINQQGIATSMVKKVFEYMPNLHQFDAIQVKITSGYDIGIASISRYATFTQTVEDWSKEIY